MRSLVSGFVLLACIAAPGIAQRTWIVDSGNGPGAHFTDLPLAVLVAAPGDRILVRSATTAYGAVTLTRGISILAIGGRASCRGITVRDVPASERVVLADLLVLGWNAARVAGPMLLEDVTVSTGTGTVSRARIVDCASVSFRGGGVSADSYLLVQRSIVFVESAALGIDAGTQSMAPAHTLVEDSVLAVNGGSLLGQQGSPFAVWGCHPPMAAVELVRSLCIATGGTRISGGHNMTATGCLLLPSGCVSPSLIANASTVVLDPSTVVSCVSPQPVHSVSLARVTVGPIAIGLPVVVRCDAPPGALAFVVGSVVPNAPTVLPQGLAWIDPATAAVAFAGIVPATGSLVQQVQVPQVVPVGAPFAFQAAIAAGNDFTLSMPSFPVAAR